METLEQRFTALFERGLRQAMVTKAGLVVTVMTIAIVAMQLLAR